MQERIICGVDDSDRTYEAVAVAGDLSRRLGLPLMLVHVVDEPDGFPFGDPDVLRRQRQKRRAQGTRVLDDVVMAFDLPPETELRVESGDAAEMLQTIAEEEDCAMLVVASRGRGRIRSALFGSVTAKLVEDLPCPLMIIAQGAGTRYRRALAAEGATVVCGIDAGSESEFLVPMADRLAASLRARLLTLDSDAPAGDEVGPSLTRVAGDRSVLALAIAAGSPWQHLAARAGCPVLVVPPPQVPDSGADLAAATTSPAD